MPASVCLPCYHRRDAVDVSTAKARVSLASTSEGDADNCIADDDPCDLCRKFLAQTEPVDVTAARKKRAAKRKQRNELLELPPPTRQKRIVTTRRIVTPPTVFDELDVLSTLRRVPGTSARGNAKFYRILAENHEGDNVEIISEAKARRVATLSNKIFLDDFESKICPHTREADGGAVMCRDAVAFMRKLVWLVCRTPDDVFIIRIYADSGRGSFKLLCSFIFNDDPLVNPDAPPGARALHAARKEGVKDTGVLRVYCLGLLEGAKESHESVRWLFDSLESLCSLPEAFPNAIITLPLDHKMQNFATGIMEGGCRYPEVHTHWSPWPQHSRPDEARTVATINADYDAREAAANEGRDDDPKLFHNVVERPIKLLEALSRQPMDLTLPVAQLHESLGEATSIYKFLGQLNEKVRRLWLRELKIRPSDRQGRTAFDGNDARELFTAKAIDSLRRLVAENPCRGKGIGIAARKNLF